MLPCPRLQRQLHHHRAEGDLLVQEPRIQVPHGGQAPSHLKHVSHTHYWDEGPQKFPRLMEHRSAETPVLKQKSVSPQKIPPNAKGNEVDSRFFCLFSPTPLPHQPSLPIFSTRQPCSSFEKQPKHGATRHASSACPSQCSVRSQKIFLSQPPNQNRGYFFHPKAPGGGVLRVQHGGAQGAADG